jgi:hypothetical protein
MNSEQKNALKESIRHWKNLLKIATKNIGEPMRPTTNHRTWKFGRSTFKIGPEECALCHIYQNVFDSYDACGKCPVFEKTGFSFCEGTPYARIERMLNDIYFDRSCKDRVMDNKLVQMVEKELNFLLSLMEKPKHSITK